MKNKKKVTLLGVAFIAAVITLAGVGYAVHNAYQGSVSTGVTNNYDVDYVTVEFSENNAFVQATNFELTWNTETAPIIEAQQVTGQQITYTWQASDILTHGLVIEATDATGNSTDQGGDTYTLKVTVAGVGADATITNATDYKLYYKLEQVQEESTNSKTGWTEFTSSCQLVTGKVVTPGAIDAGTVTQYITWAVMPDTASGTNAPVTTVAIGSITYTVEASQATPSP